MKFRYGKNDQSEYDSDRYYSYAEHCDICGKLVGYLAISDDHGLHLVHPECWGKLPENEK
jgi:hypothetical protein